MWSTVQPGDCVNITINSSGGDVDCGNAIIDLMQRCIKNGVLIQTVVYGRAQSTAALILAFGSKGHRFATPNSCLMLHRPSCCLDEDYIHKHKQAIFFYQQQEESMVRQLAEYCGQNEETLSAAIEKDVWLTAEEAFSYGLVDKIL